MGRLKRRPPAIYTPFVPCAGELDDQNGVLTRQTHEHHEADLRENIDVHRGNSHPNHGTQQAHWHHENHRQRQRPTLVLGSQHQENDDKGETEDGDHGAVGLAQRLRFGGTR